MTIDPPGASDPDWRQSTLSQGATTIVADGSDRSGRSSPENARDPEKRDGRPKNNDRAMASDARPAAVTMPTEEVEEPRHQSDAISPAISRTSSGEPQRLSHEIYAQPTNTVSRTTIFSDSKSLTRKDVTARDHLSLLLGPPIILLLDLVVPCAVYYGWLDSARRQWRNNGRQGPEPLLDAKVQGLAVIAFGLGEVYILVVRVIRLIKDREGCAPLLSEHWWELDATSWVYAAALLVALIPYVISTNLYDPDVITWLYIYPPGFLMAFLGIIAFISLIPFRLPVRLNSDPKGTRMKPMAYYAAEDFFAVDCFQGRAFRRKFKARYEANPAYRRLMYFLTIFWLFGIIMFNGLLAALIWNLKFNHAFGTSLGLLFAWIGVWAVITKFWTEYVVRREKKHARWVKARRLEEKEANSGDASALDDVERGVEPVEEVEQPRASNV